MGIFEVKITEQFTLKGNNYLVQEPKANLVIITGMNEHSERYEPFAKFLNENGISVSVLDHFGQGLNAPNPDDQEKWPVDAWSMVVKALNLKVEELRKQGKPVYLMGHSMGSFATQSYLERFPNTLDKVIIMGSNGKNNKVTISFGAKLASMRTNEKNWDKEDAFMGKMSLGPYSKAVKNRKTDLDWLSYNEDNVKRYIDDPYCGHYNTHGFFKEFMKGMNTLYKKKNLANISKKEHILLVAGEEDPVGANGKGPRSLRDMYLKLGVKDVSLILYPHMRHEILNEVEREKVYQDILNFLNK